MRTICNIRYSMSRNLKTKSARSAEVVVHCECDTNGAARNGQNGCKAEVAARLRAGYGYYFGSTNNSDQCQWTGLVVVRRPA